MRSRVFFFARIVLVVVSGIFFISCSLPIMEANPEAQTITYLKKIPQGECKFLAEIKAEDGDSGFRGDMIHPRTDATIRNNVDVLLRNTAATFGSDVKIITHKIKTLCKRRANDEISDDCATMKTQYNDAFMVYLEAYAYVYRCGEDKK